MRYYVYILLDDMIKGRYDNEYCSVEYQPFYVGKGDSKSKNKTERHLTHYKETKQNLTKIVNPHKFNKIKKLQENGFEHNFLIIYESDNEQDVLNVEKNLINFYGKEKDGGMLTNISDGGIGGNLFKDVEGLREKLNSINSKRWEGNKNPNFGKNKEETFSYKYKLEHGKHWNFGKKMSKEHKETLKKVRYDKLPIVEMVCPNTLIVLDKLKTIDAIVKYNLRPFCFYRCLNKGGKHKGYYWKYENKELVFSTSKKNDYTKPKKKYQLKKVYFKKNINDNEEILFNSINEASEKTKFNKEVIRRKCIVNNTNNNIFRYENNEYNFEIKKGKKIKIKSVDEFGNGIIYDSVTDAAEAINGNPSAITQVCKGKRKKHRNLTFKYV